MLASADIVFSVAVVGVVASVVVVVVGLKS